MEAIPVRVPPFLAVRNRGKFVGKIRSIIGKIMSIGFCRIPQIVLRISDRRGDEVAKRFLDV